MPYTLLALGLGVGISVFVSRQQDNDSDDAAEHIKHSRQDLRLIAYLLFGILLLLGIIADRVH
jgi:hypothetical protein